MYIVPICFALLSSYASAQSVGDILSEPDVVESSGGVLDTTITMEYANHTTAAFSLYNTRLLNGTMPGPTLKVSAGDTLQVLFENNLETQDTAVTGGHNVYQDPDDSNLHFHGLHVSGELKSDDVRLRVEPGEHFTYNTTIPIDHMPGTHWLQYVQKLYTR
jgi:FtsP/CotA-like multicopper oxidase with cupredoxin domain